MVTGTGKPVPYGIVTHPSGSFSCRRAEGETHRAAPQGPYIALRQRRNTSLAQQTSQIPIIPSSTFFIVIPSLPRDL